jgi:acyl-CoA thioesterase FadM
MNNSRYLAIMELGSLDIIVRTGVVKLLLRRKWRPIVASVMVRFIHELKPYETYQLHTRVIYWDQKWFFMEQHFKQEETIVAVGMVKGLFRGPKGNVATSEVFTALGHYITSPPIPESVAMWLQSETLIGEN